MPKSTSQQRQRRHSFTTASVQRAASRAAERSAATGPFARPVVTNSVWSEKTFEHAGELTEVVSSSDGTFKFCAPVCPSTFRWMRPLCSMYEWWKPITLVVTFIPDMSFSTGSGHGVLAFDYDPQDEPEYALDQLAGFYRSTQFSANVGGSCSYSPQANLALRKWRTNPNPLVEQFEEAGNIILSMDGLPASVVVGRLSYRVQFKFDTPTLTPTPGTQAIGLTPMTNPYPIFDPNKVATTLSTAVGRLVTVDNPHYLATLVDGSEPAWWRTSMWSQVPKLVALRLQRTGVYRLCAQCWGDMSNTLTTPATLMGPSDVEILDQACRNNTGAGIQRFAILNSNGLRLLTEGRQEHSVVQSSANSVVQNDIYVAKFDAGDLLIFDRATHSNLSVGPVTYYMKPIPANAATIQDKGVRMGGVNYTAELLADAKVPDWTFGMSSSSLRNVWPEAEMTIARLAPAAGAVGPATAPSACPSVPSPSAAVSRPRL